METVENRMVNEAVWREEPPVQITEKLNGNGRREMGTGIFVPEEDAYSYALERISQDEELKREFVEWLYSGNWVKE